MWFEELRVGGRGAGGGGWVCVCGTAPAPVHIITQDQQRRLGLWVYGGGAAVARWKEVQK